MEEMLHRLVLEMALVLLVIGMELLQIVQVSHIATSKLFSINCVRLFKKSHEKTTLSDTSILAQSLAAYQCSCKCIELSCLLCSITIIIRYVHLYQVLCKLMIIQVQSPSHLQWQLHALCFLILRMEQ